jgi:beta-lactamase regulating signal transducer with metallopeptidase domain
MMLAILAESALRSPLLGGVVWIGLNLLRIKNPHVHMISGAMVLAASLSMPLLMHWTTVTVTLDPLPVPALENLWPANNPLNGLLPETSLPSEGDDLIVPIGASAATFNWLGLATAIYALIAGMLLLRLAVGIYLTWRLARAAKPIDEPWTEASTEPWMADGRVRISNAIHGPVTFGSTILLPPQCADWDMEKRRAVLAHEGAHVANRDFYILLLASLNRAVFWFSPFSWWQLARLAELAEIISDAQALEIVEDKLSYAEILLDLVQDVQQAPAGLEMARPCTVKARVERILAATTPPAKLGWRKQLWTAAVILPAVIVSAGSIAYTAPPASTPVMDDAAAATKAPRHFQSITFYALGGTSIFAVSREGDDLFGQLTGQRKLLMPASADGTYSYPAVAGQITLAIGQEPNPSELTVSQNGHSSRAARIVAMSWKDADVDAKPLDSFTGWYELAPNRALTVTRDGDRLSVQPTGRPKFEVAAHGTDAFADDQNDLVIFLRDGEAKVTQILLQDPASGARLAQRVTADRARTIEDEFAKRMVEVADRFKEQTPQPGSKEAILRGIEDLQRGTPNYDRMGASLAAKIGRQAAELHMMFKTLGAVESIFFRGVGPGGYDIYGVKFANGFAELRLLLGADGKADDVIFRPDGNDEPGGVVDCSGEPGLKSRDDTAPIRLLIYNGGESDLQLYQLDSAGKRLAHGSIGQDMTSSILTYVDSPWVIADASGKCLEIVLPGQRTRLHTVAARGPERPTGPRAAPLAGSEEILRHYIEAIGRGEPDYDHMTAEVATQTRQQLALQRAILARLGALRAVSFRGVSNLGSDIYLAHFANGSAEWRISLIKDGKIGRIALGPQY